MYDEMKRMNNLSGSGPLRATGLLGPVRLSMLRDV